VDFTVKDEDTGIKLSLWSRKQIGDVHQNTVDWKIKLQSLEEIDIQVNTKQRRQDVNKAHVEYIHWMKLQESIPLQQSQCKWFEEGDKNTNYSHSMIREKRRKMNLSRIKNKREKWISEDENISKAAVKHLQTFFNRPQPSLNCDTLQCIPNLITLENVVYYA